MPLPEITLEQLQESGHRYRADFVRLPVLGLERSTRFMTVRMGVRYKETVFSPEFNAELQAYKSAERQNASGDFIPRTLETEFAACFFDFDPNTIISSLYGHAASQAGQGAVSTPGASEVAGSVLKNIGKGLNLHLFDAKKDKTQKTTATLFDGFDTIVEKEIADGNISVAKGNLYVTDKPITAQNAGDILKAALFAASDELREEETFLFCSRAIADAYNENYLLTHQGINYNTKYSQPYLEGSDNLCTFAPVAGKKGSKYLFLTTKSNMLVGVDQMSDTERVEFNKYEPKVVTGELYMFIGVNFESVDPRRLLVIQLADDAKEPEQEPEQGAEGQGSEQAGG